MRITAAAPASMLDDCNDLAMVLAFGPPDGLTYRNPSWEDADGNLYAAASWVARPEWVPKASSPLERPAWDDPEEGEGYTVNMAGAERAQDALVVWAGPGDDPDNPIPVPQASPTALTTIAGIDPHAALAAMGLTRVQEDLA